MEASIGNKAKGQSAVLARAFEDEPVRMLVVGTGPGYVEVSRSANGPTIGFPAAFVYEFDEALYAGLRKAYQAGDSATLYALWANAQHPVGLFR